MESKINSPNKTKPFWYKKWNKDNICSITHSRLRPGKNKKGISHCIFLPCNHGFYRTAIVEWINRSPSWNDPLCPMCRTPFKEELLYVKNDLFFT